MVTKPWGSYTDVIRTPTHVVKYITVLPGHSLSFQKHKMREEFWFIVSGTALVQLGGLITEMAPGTTVQIYKHERHRLSNKGTENVVVLEMQFGQCDENDIERLSDDYGRR